MQNKVKNKYATYTQSQRLDMIKDGNTDVYNNEKASNDSLRSLRKSLGLSTEDIDEWDKTVETARSESQGTKEAAIPKFQSTRVGTVSNAYNNARQRLAKDYSSEVKRAKQEAERDIEYLVEYLVNNGYASDGKAARDGEKEIRLELKNALEKLLYEYEQEAASTREKYISMLDKSRG